MSKEIKLIFSILGLVVAAATFAFNSFAPSSVKERIDSMEKRVENIDSRTYEMLLIMKANK